MKPETGLHPKVSRTTYESWEAANSSLLKHFERSAAHAHQELVHPPAPTPALIFGTNFHAAVLEPELFEKSFVVAPKVDRRTVAGRTMWAAFEAEAAGKTIVTTEDHATIEGALRSVWSHPRASALLRGAVHREVGAVWTHERTGELCKGLIDCISRDDGWTWVVDLKSTRDASPGAFAAAVARYSYHAQAAHYLAGLDAISKHKRRFAWIAVEKEAPYATAVYEPDEATLLAGEALVERWLDQYAAAKESGEWPGYSGEVQSLTVPRWALKEGDLG